jgi:DNA-nicking Smr family endonuclease
VKAREDDLRLWAVVAATVRPLPGRAALLPPPVKVAAPAPRSAPAPASAPRPARRPAPAAAAQIIEPRRYRRLVLGRERLGGRIDLHGLGQDGARAALTAFIETASARGDRGVLVITGKGALGDGVLRRRVPEWLASPPLRSLVAGISEAHRRHGGAGALYVALKRRER